LKDPSTNLSKMSSGNKRLVSSSIGNMPFMKRVADKNAAARKSRKQQELDVYKREWSAKAGAELGDAGGGSGNGKLIFVSNKKSMYLSGRRSFGGYNKHVEKHKRYLEGKPPLSDEDSDHDNDMLAEEVFVKRKNKDPSPRKRKKRRKKKQ
jgi:hypothetical protein